MEDLGNILLNDDELNEEQLKQYLSGNISGDALHNIEKQMVDSEFVNDAVEGLEQFSNKKNMAVSVEHLNKELQKQIAKKKGRKEKRKLKEQPWVYFTIILLLLLIIISYVLVKKYKDNQPLPKPAQTALLTMAHE